MNRFVPIVVVIVGFVFGSGQPGFAQVQIIDGDGKQVTPNEIPTETVEDPPVNQVPQTDPQIFGGGSRIVIRKSFRSVDENGDLKTESSGKAIVIGPDGQRQEFDLEDGQNQPLDFGGIRMDGLVPGLDANDRAESFSLGLQCKPVHPAVASQLNLETGLMVSQVPAGSPAATQVQQYDVLLFADDKQLIGNADLSQAAQAAGEADASLSLTLIRGGKEMSVSVKPEKRVAGLMDLDLMHGMPQIKLPDFEDDGLFGADALGKGMEARMRLQREAMEERIRRIQEQLGDGLIELPRSRILRRFVE